MIGQWIHALLLYEQLVRCTCTHCAVVTEGIMFPVLDKIYCIPDTL